MQIKTSLMYHFTVFRIAIVKMRRDTCWQGYGENSGSVYYWWECRFLKKLKIELTCDPPIQILGTCPAFIKWISHYSTIHNSQSLETTRVGLPVNGSRKCTHTYTHTHTHAHTHIHTHTHKMEYHSAFQNKEILHLQQHGWTWMALC